MLASIAPAFLVVFTVACNSLFGVCTTELGFAVEPTAGIISIGDSLTLRPRAWSCGGREEVPIDIVWTTTDSTVARVESTGRVTGVGIGHAIVEGTDRGRYGVGPFHVPIQVEPR